MNVLILGSTGSIGESALEVVRRSQGELKITGLTAHSNHEKLAEQAREFGVSKTLLTSLPDSEQRLEELVTHPEVDVVLVAIVGFAALRPTLAALRAGKKVALANKEALVTAGEIFAAEARKSGATIIPVDSEHNALFQALQGHPIENVKKLWITGSGGPFRGKSRAELSKVNVKEALNHPKWKMGPKITIDSATLMNKGLEFIEARWVFDVQPKDIDVIIHPQSIIHGLVEFIDGSMLAHMSATDMKAAISYALYYPRRQPDAVKALNLVELRKLEFEPVDNETFPCLRLAQRALGQGGAGPVILNAANEIAVNAFLNEEISFLSIPELISKTMEASPTQHLELDTIFEIDAWARKKAIENISSL
jgi:1-deoxy-D-xylulose-5-phosphate reductoisomerase